MASFVWPTAFEQAAEPRSLVRFVHPPGGGGGGGLGGGGGGGADPRQAGSARQQAMKLAKASLQWLPALMLDLTFISCLLAL